MREIIFDTETTGLDPQSGDRLVEIGCIEMIHRVPTGRTFHAYFNPGRSMPAGAEAVHGLSEVFLSDKGLFVDKAAELIEFLGDAKLELLPGAGHLPWVEAAAAFRSAVTGFLAEGS